MLSRGRFQTTSTDQYEVQDPVWDEYIYIVSGVSLLGLC